MGESVIELVTVVVLFAALLTLICRFVASVYRDDVTEDRPVHPHVELLRAVMSAVEGEGYKVTVSNDHGYFLFSNFGGDRPLGSVAVNWSGLLVSVHRYGVGPDERSDSGTLNVADPDMLDGVLRFVAAAALRVHDVD